jgi:hypothetical protein
MRKSLLCTSVLAAAAMAFAGASVPAAAAGLNITVNGCTSLELVGAATGSSITLNCVASSTGGTAGGPQDPPPTTNPDPNPPPNNPPSNPNAAGWDAAAKTCSQFSRTIYKEFNWANAGNMVVNTYNEGRIGANGVAIISFRTPASASGYIGANVGAVEWPGSQQPAARTVVVSEGAPACDLAFTAGWGQSAGGSVNLTFSNDPSLAIWGIPALKANTVYYVTVANRFGGSSTTSCTSSECDLRLEVGKGS